MSITRNTDFKYDLAIGELYESELSNILNNQNIEIKTDLYYQKSGNVFIEFKSRNKPSGISTTMADYFCFILPIEQNKSIHLFQTECLKKAIKLALKENKAKIIKGGDDMTSEGVLIKFSILNDYIKKINYD